MAVADVRTLPATSLAPAVTATVLLLGATDRGWCVCRRPLEAAGYRVLLASSLDDAWRAVLRERPDVVVTASPGGEDGGELTRRIRAEAPVALTRIVQISSRFTDCDHRIRALEGGADACLAEPVRPEEVLAVVRSLLRGQRTEAMFDTLLDGAPMLVAGMDHEGRLTVFNAACEAVTGYRRQDVLGLPAIETLVTPDERATVLRHVEHASADVLAMPYEARWRTVTGEDLLIQWRCFFVQPPAGGDPTILAIGEDVTETRRSEEALRSRELQLQAVMDGVPALIYLVDRDDRFLLVNQRFAEVFALDRDRVTGRSLHECLPRELVEDFAAHNRRVLTERVPLEFDVQVRHPDGLHTYVSEKVPLYDDQGEPYAVCGVFTDITERQRLTDALSEANRRKDTILATVVHELKQPLAPIMTALQLMKLRTSQASGERARAVIERQVLQLHRLIEDLLESARIARGKVELRLRPVDLRDVVADACLIVQPMFDRRQQQFSVLMPADDALIVQGDPLRLQQVLSNLLTNASKYSDDGGWVRLLVAREGTSVTVRVQDGGHGIPREMLRRVFDPFVQASAAAGGLGLGLTVVKRLVESHHGTVDARSEGPGAGTEFLVRLPVAAERPSASPSGRA